MNKKEETERDVNCEYCDICGINMTDKECTVIGTSILVQGDHKEIRRVKNAFGKTDFKICYVCWLKSLGVKERTKGFLAELHSHCLRAKLRYSLHCEELKVNDRGQK